MKSPSDKTRNTRTKKAWDAYFEMNDLITRNDQLQQKVSDTTGTIVLQAEKLGITKCMKILKDNFNLKDLE